MFVKCRDFSGQRIETDITGFIKLLKRSGILNKKGEPRERIEIYLGGPFFKGVTEHIYTDEYTWVFSTFDIDRDEERIDPKGWDLKHYLANPVILWSHDTRIPAIGYSKTVVVEKSRLKGSVVFNDKDFDPFGWGIGRRVGEGVIRAGSVGFIVQKVEIDEEGQKENLIFRNQELLEFSICNVPANPFALVQESKNENKRRFPVDYTEQIFPENGKEEDMKRFWKGLIRNQTTDGGVC